MANLRAQIDAFDDQIIALLAQRYALLAQVVKVKAANGIAHNVQARVIEVLERTQKIGVAQGLPPQFMHQLYTLVIDTAHEYESQFLKD